MARGEHYKSIAVRFIEHIKGLKTVKDFEDSFKGDNALGALYGEMQKTENQDRALLSSYYKLVNLQDAVKSSKIEAIKTAGNSFIADFKSKYRKPSPALKKFWQKFKNKLSDVLNSFSQNKISDIQQINNLENTIPPAPPLPNIKQASPSKLRINTSTSLRKTDNTKPASRKDLLSELLAKTAHRRKTETPAVSTANSDMKDQVKRSNKEITPQTQVNNQVAGIAPPPPPPLPISNKKTVAKIVTNSTIPSKAKPVSKVDVLPELSAVKQPNKEITPQTQANNQVAGIAPPPPPPLADFKPGQKDTSAVQKNQNTQKSSTNDLLADIRKKGASRNISKDHPDYKYVPILRKNISSNQNVGDLFAKAMQNKTNIQSLGDSQVAALLDGKSDEEQRNILYSAFIDKNDQLIRNLKDFKINASRSDEDDWDTLEETNSKVVTANLFTDEQFNAIKQAALETEERIERGENLISHQQPDIDKTTSQDVRDPAKASTKPSDALNHIGTHREEPKDSKVIEKQSIKPTKMTPESRMAPGAIPPPPAVRSHTQYAPATFLDSIKNHSARNLKSSVNTQHTLSTENFIYLDDNKSDLEKDTGILAASLKTRRLSVDGNKALKKEFKNLDDKAKLNKLYSYIIDNNTAKINAAINYDEEDKVFFKENLENIAKDVLIVAKKNPQSAIQIRKGLEYLATKADLDISEIEKKSISHAEQIKQQREAPSKPRTH